MAKVAAKSIAKSPAKTPRKTSAAKASDLGNNIEKVSQETLEKLKTLGVDQQLQNDLEWCLGSYRSDNNPVGLYEMAERALTILREEKNKKTKGVTAKLITDLEKALQERD